MLKIFWKKFWKKNFWKKFWKKILKRIWIFFKFIVLMAGNKKSFVILSKNGFNSYCQESAETNKTSTNDLMKLHPSHFERFKQKKTTLPLPNHPIWRLGGKTPFNKILNCEQILIKQAEIGCIDWSKGGGRVCVCLRHIIVKNLVKDLTILKDLLIFVNYAT